MFGASFTTPSWQELIDAIDIFHEANDGERRSPNLLFDLRTEDSYDRLDRSGRAGTAYEGNMGLAQERIEKPARKIRKLLKKMSSVPGPDEVHSFRTNARRLETVLESFTLNSKKNGRRLEKRISKLRKRAGKVRDFDVMTEYVSSLPYDRSEGECSVRLLEFLGAQREKEARQFDRMQKKHSSKLRRRRSALAR